MNRTILLTALLLMLAAQIAWGQIPRTISYQGVLTDAGGTVVTDGNYNLTFKLYDVSIGKSPLWSEGQSAAVNKGIFNVILGSVTPLTLPFDKAYWLGVTVGGGSELIPRIPLTASAYSLNARSVVDSAITGQKIAPGQVVRSINGLKDDVTLAAGSNVTITPSGNTLTISASGGGGGLTGSGTNGQATFWTGTATLSGDNSFMWDNANKRLGIGTGTPLANLEVTNGNVLFTGSTGATPVSGAGIRLMWIPAKAAFRVGAVGGTQWDNANIGSYSSALGYSTTASGYLSTAMGAWTTASGEGSTAMGHYTTASADYSTAMGYRTKASGDTSTAMGYWTTASGNVSTAMGSYASTNYKQGSFIIGDNSTATVTLNDANNQFMARFAGGYKLLTNTGASIGAQLPAGGNSWAVISDSTKKENLKLACGEDVLEKVRGLRLGSWNYKGQEPAQYRHYGPMAQEFFAAFGHDGIGVIGNDTTIASADIDGINLIAIQALEKRTAELETVKAELAVVKAQLSEMNEVKAKLARLESSLQNLGLKTSEFIEGASSQLMLKEESKGR